MDVGSAGDRPEDLSDAGLAALQQELGALRKALEVKSRRLAEEGAAYADVVDGQRLAIERLQEEIRIRDAEIEGLRNALRDIRSTKTFRSTERLRRVYGGLRRTFHRP